MDIRFTRNWRNIAILAVSLLAAAANAADIVVSSATPASAEQGTLALLVTIKGSNFPRNPVVRFCRTDTGSTSCDPDKVTVRSARLKGSGTIEATIDVGLDATTTNFDIEVIEPLGGRKGRGTGLFSVVQKSGNSGNAVQVPLGSFEAQFAFITTAGDQEDLRVGRFDGSVWSQVDAPGRVLLHGWSPDGQRLLYTAASRVKSKGNYVHSSWRLAIRRVDGSTAPQALLNQPVEAATWSPTLADGKQYLVYVGETKNILAREIACSASACALGDPTEISAASQASLPARPRSIAINRSGTHAVVHEEDLSARIVLYKVTFDQGQLALSNPRALVSREDLGSAFLSPLFSEAFPNQSIYWIISPDSLQSLAYDPISNAGLGSTTLVQFSEPRDIRQFDINDAGDLIYREHSAGYQTLYAVPAGGSESRIPYPSGWTQASPKLKPRAPAATP